MNGPTPAIAGSRRRASPPARGAEPFVIEPWRLEHDAGTATFHFGYRIGGEHFGEVLTMPDGVAIDDVAPIARLVDLLSVVAGVSAFKAFAPERVEYAGAPVDAAAQHLVERAYDEGMREYALRNGFDIPFTTRFPVPGTAPSTPATGVRGMPVHALVPFGGGKDSSLLARALRDVCRTTLFTVGRNPYVERVAAAVGVPLLFATRTVDPRLVASDANGYLNGHVPVTGINSLVSLVLASVLGADAVVMANERSSSSDTVDGVNHQYSKSLEFELAVRGALGPGDPDYFSALRPWGDLAIARAFAAHPELLGGFMSCNRAFLRDATRRSDGWCGTCDKCRSVFLSLAPFVAPDALVDVFGRDLLDDASHEAEWLRLVDAGNRPFDCVADVVEARQAFGLLAAQERWAGTSVVRTMIGGDVPMPLDDAVFDAVGRHAIPPDLFAHLRDEHFGWDHET